MNVQRNLGDPDNLSGLQETEIEPHNDAVFDLTDLLRVIRVRQKIILGTALAVVAVTALVLFRLTPLYSAKSLVMLDQRQNKVEDINAVLSGLPTDPTSIENQVQILRSRNLLSRVIDKQHLMQDPEFGPGKPNLLAGAVYFLNPLHWFPNSVTTKTDAEKLRDERNAMIDHLLGGETVAAQGRSSAILITFASEDANKAAAISNAIADAYVEDQLEAKFEATQKATVWLADRIQELSVQVQTAEAAVQEYKAENGLTETVNGTSLVNQQMSDLNGQLITQRSDLAEKEARYARVLQLQRTGHAEDVTQAVESPLITQLRGQETDLLRQEADLTSKYGPRHPKMLDLESQKRNLQAKIAEEVQRVVQTVGNDVAIARARVGSLQASLSKLTGESTVDSKARVKLTELQARASSSRQLYEAFLGRFKEAQGQQGIQAPDARIISRAEVPGAPSFPNKSLSLGIAIPGGFLLGFLFAMLAERLDAGFRTVHQIERLLGVPVLSTLPEILSLEKTEGQAADRVVDKPMSSFAEAVRGLQMGLVLSNVDKRPKVVLVTSSVPSEGKTTVAISLARLAAAGRLKALVIDADLRRPSVAETVRLTTTTNGLVQALTGDVPLEQCLVKDPKSTATILPAYRVAGSPPDILGSIAMERIIEGLKSHYDLIILDSAPLLPVNDTKVLARLADAVLFVVRWEKTPRDAVIEAARALADIHAPVAGVVLARADAKRYRYYSYGYQDYYAYDKYYSN
jgi:exopolysaccharide transport family protein